jgi:hypothetical protein
MAAAAWQRRAARVELFASRSGRARTAHASTVGAAQSRQDKVERVQVKSELLLWFFSFFSVRLH